LTTYRKLYMGFSKNSWNPRRLRSAILKIDMTSFFSAESGPIWTKCRRLVQNDMSTAVLWSKSKPDVEFQYGGRFGEFSGMSSRATYHVAGAATWWIHCHDSRATCHIAGCKNFICHIENRFSPYFIYLFFAFIMQFGLRRVAAFISSPIHLFIM